LGWIHDIWNLGAYKRKTGYQEKKLKLKIRCFSGILGLMDIIDEI
jgi:hypothetical protein